ncbi:MAG: dinitrogenase iron-molybdenum cofactor biosynthesis protein [Candidatus Cloacimonetes bacterium]|nr:dinitrogenase iron-molybdenum cofactor biosynthesis protein [Candidatus Cloacimonadota bacterium]
MIIAISAAGNTPDAVLDPRFGRAEHFMLYDTETHEYSHLDNGAVRTTAHGAGPQTSQKITDVGAEVVITGNGPGGNAARTLQAAGIRVLLCKKDATVKQAVGLYMQDKLTEA